MAAREGSRHRAGCQNRMVIKACALAISACLLAPREMSFVASAMVRRGGPQRRFPSLRAVPGTPSDGDSEGNSDAIARVEESSAADSSLTPGQTKADMARKRLWEMPKEVAPLLQLAQVTYKNRESRDRTRDLVVMKAKNTKAMVKKAEMIIKTGQLSKLTMKRLMRKGRENFGRDNAWQWNRPGLRAFRMRSGMKDLRYVSEKEKYQRKKNEIRPPDHKRKRKRDRPKHDLRYVGSSWKYGKGTRVARR
ncbi:unnamed protein product [Effrenium voratum]|nr:unnamed protein product [Effrenium voratum]